MPDENFLSLIGDDVTPLTKEPRVFVERKNSLTVDKTPRRSSAEAEQEDKADPLCSEPVEMLDPNAELSFIRPGVQHGVYKRLRLGKYSLDARLDLHRQTVEQARRAVYEFINDCLANDVRAALVTHGKGVGRAKPALLKSCVAHWLPQIENVLAFHSAKNQHGGTGATYVLIKKSAKKKLETKLKNTRKD